VIAALEAAYALVILILVGLASFTLAWMLYAWRDRDSLRASSGLATVQPRYRPGDLSFSLLVPARHEERVLPRTLERLVAMDHPAFEVIVIVGHDDPGTAAVAQAVQRRYPEQVGVVVDSHTVKSKPRALNTALPYCRGDVVAVFDAEDLVHPGLLRVVEQRMLADRCAALQAGVQLMNFWSSWFALRNVLEYYFWFRSRLHLQADRGFIPLAGNTVFVRRALLDLLGGWDGDCLAEDCDLGVRLCSHGFTVSVIYDPELVTREEAPASVRAFVKQRTRWNQGFLQVLFKCDWRLLPHRGQRHLAVFTLMTPFLQAFTGVLLPVSLLTMAVASLPAGLAMLSFLPIVPTVIASVIEHLALIDFGRLFQQQVRLRDHVRLALGTPMFQAVLAFAAMRAVLRQLRGNGSWEKTAHAGLHMRAPLSTELQA
jgi:glycosyltransferase XagB